MSEMSGMSGAAGMRPAPMSPRRWLLTAALAAPLCALDLATKSLARARLYDAEPIPVLPWLLDLHLTLNRGVAFSLLPTDPGSWQHLLLLVVLLAATGLILWLALRAPGALEYAGWTLIASGAAGNLVERFAQGAVTDFLHLRLGDFSLFVFNLADCAISLGVALLLYDAFVQPRGGAVRDAPAGGSS